ncbi:hypothetical protein ACHAXS_010741 [Conticribra weissflogii]
MANHQNKRAEITNGNEPNVSQTNGYELEQSLRGHQGYVTSIAFNPSCRSKDTFSNSSHDNDANWYSKNEIKDTDHEKGNVKPNNNSRHPQRQIASSSSDGHIMIWNIFQADKVRAYRLISGGNNGPVNKVIYSPSGKTLVSCGSSDHAVRFWNPSFHFTKGESLVLRGHAGNVRCVDFGPSVSSASLSSTENSTTSTTDPARSIIPSEALLLTCSDDKTIKLWSLPKTNFQSSFVGHTNWVRVAKFAKICDSHTGGNNILTSLAASGGDDYTVRIWNCESGGNVATYGYWDQGSSSSASCSSGGVRDLCFLHSASSLAACGTDGIKVYDMRSDAMVQRLGIHCSSKVSGTSASLQWTKNVNTLSLHPDGLQLLSAEDDSATMWDLRHSSKPMFVMNSINSIGSQSITNNGRSISLVTSPPSRSRRRGNIGCNIPTTAIFSSDGRRFAVSFKDSAVRMYARNGVTSNGDDGDNRRDECPGDGGSLRRKSSDATRSPRITNKTNGKEIVTEDTARNEGSQNVPNDNSYSSFPPTNSPSRCMDTTISSPPAPKSPTPTPAPISRSSTTPKYNRESIPELLSGTLDRIVNKLDIIAQTVIVLEKRLSVTESMIARIQSGKENHLKNSTRQHDCSLERKER